MPINRCANLLIEIGTEELPPKTLQTLGEAFLSGCVAALQKSKLVERNAPTRWFATPRRLAVWIADVKIKQPDLNTERKGPAVQAAFDAHGQPTRAALGFAGSCGVAVEDLHRATSGKGEWLVFRTKQKGLPANSLIPICIEQSIKQLPIAKRMRWGTFESEFVRPVHWVTVLHGDKLVKATILSIQTGRHTMGHRFHCPHKLPLSTADDYEHTLLTEGTVIADFEKRRAQIKKQVTALAKKKGGTACIDNALLDEVTGLVEYPCALLGSFDQTFLDLPKEVLVSSMRDHQKYFHLTSPNGQLLPFFITVSNIRSTTPRHIRRGNERVLRARLADAQFFWDTDRKRPLAQHGLRLSEILFHRTLGSVADKRQRLEYLAATVAPLCGQDQDLCVRAAQLAKADLVTDMVGEFPDLQGIMGSYYAQLDSEHEQVARACAEHYQPRFAGDELPCSGVGKVIALVDRLDSLLGIFSAGEEPSGDKDPYGLRRAALAVLRLIIEGKFDLDLTELLREAVRAYESCRVNVSRETVNQVYAFVMDRLRRYYSEQGFAADEIASVMATHPTRPCDFDLRLRAVAKFRQLDEAANLAAANKRIRNILRKSDGNIAAEFDLSLLRDPAERELADNLQALDSAVRDVFKQGHYETGLGRLAALKPSVDRFFDEVLVMAEDEALKRNRLALLGRLQNLFLQVADISYLQD